MKRGRKLKRAKRVYRRIRNYKARPRRRRGHKIHIAPTIAIASTVITPCPSGRTIMQDITNGDWEGLLYDAREKYAGIDNTGKLQFSWLLQTYLPIVTAGLVSKFAGKFVNHHFDKIPFIGKYLAL